MDSVADLVSSLLKKNLVVVLIPGLVVPLFIQFPTWQGTLGSLIEPTSPSLFALKMLWDIAVIGGLAGIAFIALMAVFAVLVTVDEHFIKSGTKVFSGGVLIGAVGLWMLYAYQFNVGREHLSIPPWMFTYASAILIVLQGESREAESVRERRT